jgi:hypothetical protein
MKNCFALTFWLFEDIGFKMTISLDDQIWTRENPKNVKLQNKLFWKGSWCWSCKDKSTESLLSISCKDKSTESPLSISCKDKSTKNTKRTHD